MSLIIVQFDIFSSKHGFFPTLFWPYGSAASAIFNGFGIPKLPKQPFLKVVPFVFCWPTFLTSAGLALVWQFNSCPQLISIFHPKLKRWSGHFYKASLFSIHKSHLAGESWSGVSDLLNFLYFQNSLIYFVIST